MKGKAGSDPDALPVEEEVEDDSHHPHPRHHPHLHPQQVIRHEGNRSSKSSRAVISLSLNSHPPPPPNPAKPFFPVTLRLPAHMSTAVANLGGGGGAE